MQKELVARKDNKANNTNNKNNQLNFTRRSSTLLPMHKAMSMQLILQSNNDLSPIHNSFQNNQAIKSKQGPKTKRSKSFVLKKMSSNQKFKEIMEDQNWMKSLESLEENIKKLKYQTSLAKTWENQNLR